MYHSIGNLKLNLFFLSKQYHFYQNIVGVMRGENMDSFCRFSKICIPFVDFQKNSADSALFESSDNINIDCGYYRE